MGGAGEMQYNFKTHASLLKSCEFVWSFYELLAKIVVYLIKYKVLGKNIRLLSIGDRIYC
jgi:hypothetical protein